MSGDGLEDLWLWDSRGKRAYDDGRLTPYDKRYYEWIQRLRSVAICNVCGGHAYYRYAPAEFDSNGNIIDPDIEYDRWRCEEHAPICAVDPEQYDGEWDYFEFMWDITL